MADSNLTPEQEANDKLAAQQWHPAKNTTSYEDIPVYLNKQPDYWWVCELGHEFTAKKTARVIKGVGCQYCSNRKVLSGFNDVATRHPVWAAEWSPNNPLPANEVGAGQDKESLWVCSQGHEWSANVGQRERGRACPYCQNAKVLAGFNDLGALFPEVASEWDTEKNTLTPAEVLPGSPKKYWFVCSEGHSYEAGLDKRTAKGSGCRICVGLEVLQGYNDLETMFPDVAALWDYSANPENLNPTNTYAKTSKRLHWVCQNDHSWSLPVYQQVVKDNPCNACTKERLNPPTLKVYNITVTHPELAAEWHPTKNGTLTPEMVTKGTNQLVWWLGVTCGHEWDMNVSTRTHPLRGQNCPICSSQRLSVGVNDLATTHPELAAEWHPTKNEFTPDSVIAGNKNKAWWVGAECGHEWYAPIYKRVGGAGCHLCNNYLTVTGINDFATSQPELMEEWHPTLNEDLNPSELPAGGGAGKAWWVCSRKGHEYHSSIAGRVAGLGCPECWGNRYVSHAEQKLCDYIQELLPGVEVIQSHRKLLRGIELDIYVPSLKIAFEFNGLYWHTEARRGKSYHYDKWAACKEEGVQLVQIWEDDWNRDPELIKRMVAHKLGMNTQLRVNGRGTESVELVGGPEVLEFFNRNHIQGFVTGSHYVGLRVKETGALVAAMVLKRGASTEDGLNLLRYATSGSVVGGFTKLLTFAERNYTPTRIVTFSDHCVSDGGLYEGSGFVAEAELAADYMYLVHGERKHKFGYRLQRFRSDPHLIFEDGLSERELAELNNLERIWDAGKTRWVKTYT